MRLTFSLIFVILIEWTAAPPGSRRRQNIRITTDEGTSVEISIEENSRQEVQEQSRNRERSPPPPPVASVETDESAAAYGDRGEDSAKRARLHRSSEKESMLATIWSREGKLTGEERDKLYELTRLMSEDGRMSSGDYDVMKEMYEKAYAEDIARIMTALPTMREEERLDVMRTVERIWDKKYVSVGGGEDKFEKALAALENAEVGAGISEMRRDTDAGISMLETDEEKGAVISRLQQVTEIGAGISRRQRETEVGAGDSTFRRGAEGLSLLRNAFAKIAEESSAMQAPPPPSQPLLRNAFAVTAEETSAMQMTPPLPIAPVDFDSGIVDIDIDAETLNLLRDVFAEEPSMTPPPQSASVHLDSAVAVKDDAAAGPSTSAGPKIPTEPEVDDGSCSICWEEIEESHLRFLPCTHKFHDSCITQWCRLQRMCPICRTYFDSHGNPIPEPNRSDNNFNGTVPIVIEVESDSADVEGFGNHLDDFSDHNTTSNDHDSTFNSSDDSDSNDGDVAESDMLSLATFIRDHYR